MRRWAAVVALLLVAAAANAHRVPGAVSTLVLVPGTGEVEITHRLPAHDAITLLAPGIGIDSVDGLAAISLHVTDRFAVRLDGEPVTLDYIGAEVDGDDILIYQVFACTETPQVLATKVSFFDSSGTIPTNQVVWQSAGRTLSISSVPADGWQELALAAANDEITGS
ncbi:MAG: DUF6702 family protein [Pseudomonadota bacterium]